MDTQGQIVYFLLYVALGFGAGFIYEPFALVRLFCRCDGTKNRALGGVIDVVFWLSVCLLVNISVYYGHFPAFRLYMWIGFFVGGTIYCKTLRRILAIFENLCYNTCKSIVKKVKTRRKAPKVRGKEKVWRKKSYKN